MRTKADLRKNGKKGPPDPVAVACGERILQARNALKLSQRELAEAVGVGGDGTVSNWESGDRMPSAINVLRLSEKLGLSIPFLLEGREDLVRQPEVTVLVTEARDLLTQVEKRLALLDVVTSDHKTKSAGDPAKVNTPGSFIAEDQYKKARGKARAKDERKSMEAQG